jgi:REP element-mobilizing transposase RayT
MVRPLRIEYPGAVYHVINRGNAGLAIFKSKRDREQFLEYLAKMAERFGVRIYCYCLMSNHYHLLIETPEANLSQAMQWLNASYAMYFNVKRSRRGHLFQGRFKSILVEADAYLKQLSRYIHLNPIRVNMVDRLVDYPWSSYPAFVGQEELPNWLEADRVLSTFAKTRKTAQRKYADFVENADIENLKNPSTERTSGMILGRSEFVDWVRKSILKNRKGNIEISGLSDLKPRPGVQDIIAQVADYYGCSQETVNVSGIKNNLPRDVAIYICKKRSGLKTVDLGQQFGGVRGQAISMGSRRVERELNRKPRLQRDIKRILKKIDS